MLPVHSIRREIMNEFVRVSRRFNSWMNSVSGIFLILMMLLTVADVALRVFGSPILGTYEIVSIAGALIIALAMPQTSSEKGHICVDFFFEKRSPGVQRILYVATRVVAIALFALLAWGLISKSLGLSRAGEVTATLHVPRYPVGYLMAVCCFLQCVTLVNDIIKTLSQEESK